MRKRDGEIWVDDCIEVFISPLPEGRPYCHLAVNSRAVLFDQSVGRDSEEMNFDWNSATRVEARVGKKAWEMAMAVPLADVMGLDPKSKRGRALRRGETWRVNVCREFQRGPKLFCWSPTFGGFHTPERYGYVTFK